MNTFPLQIVTPDGLIYDGDAIMIHCRTMVGDIGIRAHHINYITGLGMGECRIDISQNEKLYAACIGGMLAVADGQARIVATTFEWANIIDIGRAKEAKNHAEKIINSDPDEEKLKQAKSKFFRASVRLNVAKNFQTNRKSI